MKNTILKSIFALVMAFIALPMMGQNYLKIYFKDGHTERHFMHLVNNISMSKYDLEGNLHSDYQLQQIVMPDTTYSYYLADIDSMTFRKVDEEQIINNATSALSTIWALLNDCENVRDLFKYAEVIKKDPGIESVDFFENTIVVRIKDWKNIYFIDTPKIISPLLSKSDEMSPLLAKGIKLNDIGINQSVRVAIVNQNTKNEERAWQTDYWENLQREFIELGYDADYIPLPGLDFFSKEIFDYDIVMLTTHGCFSTNEHWFCTSEEIGEMTYRSFFGIHDTELEEMTKNSYELYYNLKYDLDDIAFSFIDETRDGKNKGILYAFCSESYIKRSPYRFKHDNAIIFANVCESLDGNNSVADMLFNKGASIYLGYKGSTGYGYDSGKIFYESLLNGVSVQYAYNQLPANRRVESDFKNATLELIDKNGTDKFITKTVTAPDSDVKDEILEDGTHLLTLYGYTTLLDNESLNKGFLLSRYSDMSNVQDVPVTNSYTKTDNENGNYRFQRSLTLNPGEDVYYRAYTYDDGLNYNYGNVEHFTIDYPTLTLSTKSISLKVGETSTIDITSGSGSYSIEEIKPTGVVTASISENHISIEALTGGTATITVKDDKSGETVPIEVKVEWDHLSFAIDGTVDLKVGESTTIDITSGSGTYSIEEIKPTGVVTASISENSVIIEALKAGTATITVKDDKSGEKAPIEVKVQVKDIPAEAIDLGLPSGILWASYNVGATTPEEYGSYFAWGEIEDKDVYYWTTYSHCDGVSNSCHDIGADISGTRFDVAHMRWEGDWRMPTAEEFKELVYQCDYQVTTQNGVYGFKFTGPNGNSIFFPAAGYRFNTGINKAGSSGEYWSSTVRENKNYAYDTSMSADYVYWDCYINRFAGLPVRPVKQAAPALEDLVLSTTSPISLKAGETYTVQIISGNGVYSIYDNTAPNVVSASISENNVIIEALTAGTATITIKDNKSGDTAPIEVTVTGGTEPVSYLTCPDDHHPHMIDLGLPSGTKWACCNVGATSPEGYGGLYAWGETEEKATYDWNSYILCDGTQETCYDLGESISGTQYDVAHVKWGEGWQMPSWDQFEELVDNCTFEWTEHNGTNCRKLISKMNGGFIFLPAAGRIIDSVGIRQRSSIGCYWTGTSFPGENSLAINYLYLSDSSGQFTGWRRSSGYSVRPVAK